MAFLTMEVSGRHARTRAITRDTISPANRLVIGCQLRPGVTASAQPVAPVSYPRRVVCSQNINGEPLCD
jgi:hypothetical protein